MGSMSLWRLWFTATFQTIIGFSISFDFTFLNNLETEIKNFANSSLHAHYGIELTHNASHWLWAATSSMPFFGAFFSGLWLKYALEKLGRRNSMMVAKNLILMPAFGLQLIAQWLNCFELLLLGRFLSGCCLGLTNVIPIYISECSPIQLRSLMASVCSAMGSKIWNLIGGLLGLLATPRTWPLMYLCPLLAALAHILSTPLSPNSTSIHHACPTVKKVNLQLALKALQFKWPLVLCCVTLAMSPLSGVPVSFAYSTGIIVDAGAHPAYASIYGILSVQTVNLCFSLVALWLLYKLGCRKMLLIGLTCACIGTACLTVTSSICVYSNLVSTVASLVGLVMINSGNTLGPGMLGNMLPAELAPETSRPVTCAVAGVCLSSCNLALIFTFPPLNAAFGSVCLAPLFFANLAALWFIWKYMPETRNKSIDDIVTGWMPKRKVAHENIFNKY